MPLKLDDYYCENCGHTSELLVDSNEEKEIKCESCGSLNLKKEISIGVGKGGHSSWAKWRV